MIPVTCGKRAIASNYHKIQPVDLDQLELASFDQCFERLLNSSRVPDLFDQLMTAAEKILASGEIDSSCALEAINRLLIVLRKNRHGSLAAIRGTAWFAVFVKNLLTKLAESCPGIGPAVQAYRETCEEMQEAVNELEREFASESLTTLNIKVRQIEKLTGLTISQLSDEDAHPHSPRLSGKTDSES